MWQPASQPYPNRLDRHGGMWQPVPVYPPGRQPHGVPMPRGAPMLPPVYQQKPPVYIRASAPVCCGICCSLCLIISYVALIPIVEWVSFALLYFGDSYHDPRECTEFTFNAFDGGVLNGISCNFGVESNNRRPVIVFGGNAMDMYDTAQHMPKMLPQGESWQAFSMSMPGRQYAGGRDVQTSPEEAIREANALLEYVWTQTGQKAVIFGWSLGSSLATGLAATATQEHVRCLLVGNPFSSFRELALRLTAYLAAPWYYMLPEWPTADWAAQVTAPTIVFSSLDDSLIPVWMHTQVFERSAATRKMLVERHAPHMGFRAFIDAADSVLEICDPPARPIPNP